MQATFSQKSTAPCFFLALVIAALIFGGCQSDAACINPPPGLVGWWRAENSGQDSVAGNTAYPSNGVAFAAGEVSQAFNLNGSSAYLKVNANSNLDVGPGAGLTIEAWIQPRDLSFAQPLVEFDDGYNLGVHLWISEPWFENQGGPGDLFANITDMGGGTHALVSVPGVLNTSAFQHVAVTYDKSSGLGVLYVNGAVVYSHNLGVFTPQTSFDLYFGLRPSSQYPSIYNGLLDEVSLYSRALSEGEIQAIVAAGTAGKCASSNPAPTNCIVPPAGLVSWWRGEGNAVDATDGNSGAQMNGVAFTNGLVGHGFDFNGTSAFVQVPDSANLRFTNAMTVETWIYPRAVGSHYREIVSKWEGGVEQRSYTFNIQPSGQADFTIDHDGSAGNIASAMSTNGVPLNQWTHLAGVYDGVRVKLYLNGVLHSAAVSSGPIFAGSAPLIIGSTLLSGSYFEGIVDEPSVYNRALTDAEIGSIYQAGSAGKCAPPAAPPNISAQPQGQTVAIGATASFTVTATGSSPLVFQWRKGTNNIPSATASAFSIFNAQHQDSGTYSVVVSNDFGWMVSSDATLTVIGPSNSCVPIPSGLVSWWRGEGNVDDASGGNSGALLNGASFTNSLIGQAFAFNGTTAFIQVPDAANLRFTNAMTVETWIYPRAVGSHYREIVSKWEGGVDQRSYTFNIQPSGQADFTIGHDGSAGNIASAMSTNTVPMNQWTHLAGVYDGTTVKLYVNGVLHGTTASPGAIFAGSAPLAIGSTLISGSYFDGFIDEPTVYNRALADSEVGPIYQAGSAGKCASRGSGPTNCLTPPVGLISWWPAEGDASDSADGNSGMLINGIVFTNGVVGQAFSFDGINDHVRIADNSNLRLTSALTIEAWIFPITSASFHEIVSKWNLVADGQKSYTTSIDPDGRAYLTVSPTGTDAGHGSVLSTNTIPLNQWTHFAATYDGTNLNMYINGQFQTSTAYASGIFPGTNDLAIGGYVGAAPVGQVGSPFAGFIDEPSIYGRALAASEINALYTAGASGKCHAPTPPFIVGQPPSQAVLIGSTVSFSVVAGGSSPLAYQWTFNGTNLLSATFSSLARTNVQISDAGNYAVLITNAFGSITSSNALLTVTSAPPLIVSQPQSRSVRAGTNVSFSVTASGTPPLFYQWSKGATNIAGATSSTYSISNCQAADAGSYSVIVSNAYGVALSSNAVLTVLVGGKNIFISGSAMNSIIQSDLFALGHTSTLVSSAGLLSNTFAGFDAIWLGTGANVTAITNRRDELVNFVSAGGVLFIELTTSNGFGGFPFSTGVTAVAIAGNAVHIANPGHPINANLTDSGLSNWSSSYHTYFPFIDGFTGVTDRGVSNNWVTIEKPVGKGHIVFSGQDISSHIQSGAGSTGPASAKGVMLDNILRLPANNPPVANNLAAATRQNVAIAIQVEKLIASASDPENDPIILNSVSSTSTNGGSVSVSSNAVNYTPALNFIGADRFSYSVSDGRGGTASAFVLIQVRSADLPSGNMLPPIAISGGFEVSFVGIPGRTYNLQRATNVSGLWLSLAPVTVGPDGLGSYADTNAPMANAFYRTVYP
ncbi:MAG TPA: LamG-like jellyroll fold domain-containing protein [Candidatus Dormibacteraeota bacterium]|nr:LamG-like jellyroll fold domain-containing protein [Candidatus Dormibacteraeota bacterium]